jgi:flagellar biogenesis protein FliO
MRAVIELEAFILTIIFVAFILLLTVIGMAVWLVKIIGKSTKRGKLREEYARKKIPSVEHRNRQND